MLDAATRPDGSWLVAFADNDAVVVVEVATGRRIARVAKGDGTRAVQFSGDGLFLCTGEAKRARIWENTGRELLSARDRPVSGEAVAMSRDGRLVALISRDGLFLWDRTTHKRHPVRPMRRFSGQVRHLAFSWDASRLLFAVDSVLEMIALPSGVTLWGTNLPAPVLAAEFAPDDQLIAVASHPPGGVVGLVPRYRDRRRNWTGSPRPPDRAVMPDSAQTDASSSARKATMRCSGPWRTSPRSPAARPPGRRPGKEGT